MASSVGIFEITVISGFLIGLVLLLAFEVRLAGTTRAVGDELQQIEGQLQEYRSYTKYLRRKDRVNYGERVGQIFDSMLKTPGERRALGPKVLEAGIIQGVKQGLFGLGDLKDNNTPVCRYLKEDATVSATDVEVLIREDLCIAQRKSQLPTPGVPEVGPFLPGTGSAQLSSGEPEGAATLVESKNELSLRFRVPRGKVSQIMGMMNFLQSKYQSLDVELTAREVPCPKRNMQARSRKPLGS